MGALSSYFKYKSGNSHNKTREKKQHNNSDNAHEKSTSGVSFEEDEIFIISYFSDIKKLSNVTLGIYSL